MYDISFNEVKLIFGFVTGPTIAEIQKFIEITDDARREGEAVGVHCAEGEPSTFGFQILPEIKDFWEV